MQGSLFEAAKQDIQFILRTVPKWRLVLLASLAVLFVKGRRTTRALALLALALLGYSTLSPYFHQLALGQRFQGPSSPAQHVWPAQQSVRPLGYGAGVSGEWENGQGTAQQNAWVVR